MNVLKVCIQIFLSQFVNFVAKSKLITLTGWLALFPLASPVLPQTIPDDTLGAEKTVITNDVEVRGAIADLVEGGAVRDINLFHSFDKLNVGEGLRLYFANPVGIENIIGRVTGGDVSRIMGTLGVDGGANLFLSNPQGFVFGENAQLDVTGSFLATTGSLQFEDGFEYGATDTQTDSPLTISVPLGLQLGANGGEIINRGNLAAGQDLSLIAGDLDLEGQVAAGGDLLLLGERVKIRDRVDAPFIAVAGGDLLVQGNESVDIFALNHGDSGLFSVGDMKLESANAVRGDAHYWSRGDFRIEGLDGGLGDLFSPNDPVIRTNSDVLIGGYIGASLHIIAGGKVEIPGTVMITGADPVYGLQETITLSNGTTQVAIDGLGELTLDIRAGVDPVAIGSPFFSGSGRDIFFPPINVLSSTSADITIGNVVTNTVFESGGKVLLTNQYKPNTLLEGSITVGAIDTSDFFGGGEVSIDSRDNIVLNGGVNVSPTFFSSTFFSDAGNVNLLADGNIDINSNISAAGLLGGSIILDSKETISLVSGQIISNSSTTSPNQKGDDITVHANSLLLTDGASIAIGTFGGSNTGNINITTDFLSITNGADIAASTFGQGSIGNINITASQSVSLNGENSHGRPTGIANQVALGAEGKGGTITLSTGSLSITDGAGISTDTFGKGSAGDIDIVASQSVFLNGENSHGRPSAITSLVATGAEGKGGTITLSTDSLSITDGAGISASTFGQGSAGDVDITASQFVSLTGESGNGRPSVISSQVTPRAKGKGGTITLSTGSLSLTGGSRIDASTFSQGNAGDIDITASQFISLDGESSHGQISEIASQVELGGEGKGGDINLSTSSLFLTGGSRINANTFGQGNAGDIDITASQSISLDGESSHGQISEIGSRVLPRGEGKGGDINLSTGSLSLTGGSRIDASTFGQGNAGDIDITASQSISLDGENSSGLPSEISSQVFSAGEGKGGDINLSTGSLSLTGGSRINTSTQGNGSAGDIDIALSSLSLAGGSRINASTFGQGNAGDIDITASQSISLDGENSFGLPSAILSRVRTRGVGKGGDIDLSTGSLSLTKGALISASTFGKGEGGDIDISASQSLSLDGKNKFGLPSLIASQVLPGAEGEGGDINLSASSLSLTKGALISASTFGEGEGGDINLSASGINLSASQVSSETWSNGRGGDMRINTSNLTLNKGTSISSTSFGLGNAGYIDINVGMHLNTNNSDISTASVLSAGGRINITAWDIFLKGDSNISTFVFSGEGGGGDITINAGSVLAFDDSDILSFARDGKGGDITLNTPAFFGENFVPAPFGTDPTTLQGNGQVDVNASGAINGTITQPDVTPVTNNLSELPENPIDTDALLNNSCIVRTEEQQGNFTITGSGNLPAAPGNAATSSYPTGEVQTLTKEKADAYQQQSELVVETTAEAGLFHEELAMSRECP